MDWRSQARVLFFMFHVAMVVIMSLPRPGQLNHREAWDKPRIQRNFTRAAQLVSAVGPQISAESLEDRTFAAALAYLKVHEAMQVPFKPYLRVAAVDQGWRMFLGGRARGSRLRIEVREGDRYRTVFERGHPTHSWQRRLLSLHRFRKFGSYREKHKGDTGRLARYLARSAARDFPEATKLRVSQLVFETPSPGSLKAGITPKATAMHTRRVELRQYR